MRIKIYHSLSVIIIIALLVIFSFAFPKVFLRTWYSLEELGTSFVNYIEILFDFDFGITALVNRSNYIEGFSFTVFPDIPENFWKYLSIWFIQMFSKGYWDIYSGHLINVLLIVSQSTVFILPFVVFLHVALINRFYSNHERAVSIVSRPLYLFNSFCEKWNVVFDNVKDFFYFFKSKKYYLIPFLLTILYFTNIINIFIGLLAYYFYIVSTLNLGSIWAQIVRLVTDLSHTFRGEFLPFWIIVGVYIIYRIFIKIADSRKTYYLEKNRIFVSKELGLATLFEGTMAKGKTTLMTDCSLTTESFFKDTALEMMIQKSLLFPEIDFKSIEEKMNDCFFSKTEILKDNRNKPICNSNGEIIKRPKLYNLSTIKAWCKKHIAEEYKDWYVECGGFRYSLYDVLYDYIQLYWIYSSPTSLILGNYAIRSGIFAFDSDHLVEYFNDFMESNSEMWEESNYAHIFDFNNFRTGKQINYRLEWSNAVDIGVFSFDEIGKERLNKTELEDVKKGADTVNQKNDGFNRSIKMGRHQSTVGNFPFFKIFAAEQREASVPADYRELNDVIVDIKPDVKDFNVFPFFDYFDWILTGFESFLMKYFKKYRFNRDDLTLIFQLIKNCLSKITRIKTSLFNKYGVKEIPISLKNGSGLEYRSTQYYLVISKIYSHRFSTDAYADFFEVRGLDSNFGLNDIQTFGSVRASLDELKLENSYFINSLINRSDEIGQSSDDKSKKKGRYKKW